MSTARPSSLARFRLPLSIVAAGVAALAMSVTTTGAAAGVGSAAAATPTPSAPSPSGSAPSPSVSAPNTSPFPPGAPTDLTATQITSTSVTLSWTAATPGCCPVAGYEITYNEAFNDIIYIQNVGDVTTVTITNGIRPTGQYRFWIAARDVVGHRSSSSSTLTVVTPVANTGDTTPPPGPHSLTAGDVTATTVQLSWTAPADTSDVAGYQVYSFDGLFVSTLLGTTSDTTFTAPIVSGPMRSYYVRARDAAGNLSVASNTVRVNPTSASPSTPGSPSPAPLACRVTYTSQSQWTNGFVAGITLANTGTTAIDGWTLSYTFGGDQQITGSWGASTSQTGATVTMRNAAWNAVVQPGASVSFGIQGMWQASNAPPTAFTVNGVACASG